MKSSPLLSPRTAYGILFALIGIYIAGYTWMAWQLHAAFITSADDLSNVDQVVWNSQHGRLLERTTGTRSVPRYGEHVEPIWVALGLLYFGWDDVRALLLVQTVFLAIGAVPVFWLARAAWGRASPDNIAGLVFAVVYLLSPFVTRANIAEVHALPFAIAPLLCAIYWSWQGRWKRVIPLVVLLLLIREDAGLLVIALGIWIALTKREWKWGSAFVASGIAGVLITVFGIIGTFADERFSGQSNSIFFERYTAFGDGPLGIVWGMLTRWDLWAELLRDPYRVAFFRDFVTSVGGLGLFSPLSWVLFLPHFVLNLFSDYFGQYGNLQHYGAPLVAGWIAAAIFGGVTLWKWGRYNPVVRYGLLLFAFGGALWTARTATGQPLAQDWITPPVTLHHRLLNVLAAPIPADAPLSADPQLHPHLAHRHDAYRFPTVGDNTEWILVDVTTNTTRHPADLRTDIEELLAQDWGIANAQDGYLLLQKENPIKKIPLAFYSFGEATTAPDVPLHTKFGDMVEVVGYTLTQDFWGRVAVEWYLRPLQTIPESVRLDAALLQADGTPITDTVGQPMPFLVWLPPQQWEVGRTYKVRTLPRETPDILFPAIAMWDGDTALPVTACDEECEAQLSAMGRNPTVGAWLTGGEWTVQNNHAAPGTNGWRRFTPLLEPTLSPATWSVALLDAWNVERTDTEITLTLQWHASENAIPPTQRFVHIVPSTGAPVPFAQLDEPLGNDYPATTWTLGEWVTETLTIPLPADAPSDWRILVGLYDPTTGQRLPVTPDAGDSTFEIK